jgi:hypothetical protein
MQNFTVTAGNETQYINLYILMLSSQHANELTRPICVYYEAQNHINKSCLLILMFININSDEGMKEKVGPDVSPRLVFGKCSVRISAGTPPILRFWWFFSVTLENTGILPRLGHDRFLPNRIRHPTNRLYLVSLLKASLNNPLKDTHTRNECLSTMV